MPTKPPPPLKRPKPPAPKKKYFPGKKSGPSMAKYSADEAAVSNWGAKRQGVRKSTRKAANKALKTMFPKRKAWK